MKALFDTGSYYEARTRTEVCSFQESGNSDYWCSKPFSFNVDDDEGLEPMQYPKQLADIDGYDRYYSPEDVEKFGLMLCSFYVLNSVGDWLRGDDGFTELWEKWGV
jgi:hypothetical protein